MFQKILSVTPAELLIPISILIMAKNALRLNVRSAIQFHHCINDTVLYQNTFALTAAMLCSFGSKIEIVPSINAIMTTAPSIFQRNRSLTSAKECFKKSNLLSLNSITNSVNIILPISNLSILHRLPILTSLLSEIPLILLP